MDVAVLAIALFILYLFGLNSANMLFGCRLQHALRNNLYFRHLVTFGYVLFISVYADQAFAASSFWSLFGYALLIYGWFILTTRIHHILLLLVLILLMYVYVLGIKKKKADESETKNLELHQRYAVYGVGVVTLVGVLFYYWKQRSDKKHKFSMIKFVFGKTVCDSAK